MKYLTAINIDSLNPNGNINNSNGRKGKVSLRKRINILIIVHALGLIMKLDKVTIALTNTYCP